MQIDEGLMETWKRSVLEIQRFCNWSTLWNGERYFSDAVPKEVGGQDLYIVTAYNPGSDPLPEMENKSRDKQLFSRISSLGSAGSFVSVGRSLSGSHEEFGYAIYAVSKNEVDQLAKEFGQIGYYRFTPSSMEIYALDEYGEFSRVLEI
ncbi:MAG: DUF3293 domain-containing protein [Acidimicrobiaceae bacterium]|nr:DUF3293 domain-containing protein [Acidimicrobiaceae bacterium]